MSSATLHASASTNETAVDEAAILSLIQSLHQAQHDKSAAGIAAPFTPHAVIYDLEPPLAHVGISIPRKEAWLATWASPIDLEHSGFQLTIDGNHAYGHGFLQMTGVKKGADNGADRAVSFWMRLTVIFERAAGQWRIVHEHTSVPFYMDGSLRPAFDLQP